MRDNKYTSEKFFAGSCFCRQVKRGKSTLINSLIGRKSIAYTSSKPGKTQTINFYNINEKFYFVDLPGYGYTKAPKGEKEKWGEMIDRYLDESMVLKAVFMLVDIRHDPTLGDKDMYRWILSRGYEPIVIATKLDKIKRSQLQKQLKQIKDALKVVPDTRIIPYSAVTGQGRQELWDVIEHFVE